MKSSLVFLTYLSRSGSTYLASLLNKYTDIGVSIEAEFIDGWINAGFQPVQSESMLDTYLESLYRDRKFQQWNIDKASLYKKLRNSQFPLQFIDILHECLALYFYPEQYPVMIFKGGHYYRCIDIIRKEYPYAKFIFVDRDPRAIYSSQKKSIDSRTGQPMLQNILHFAFGYIDTQKKLNAYRDCEYVLVSKYEELVSDSTAELSKILNFLGVENTLKINEMSYIEKIPETQKHLHPNVQSDKPKKDRIDGWKQELPVEDILFLENVLAPWLIKNGYVMSDKNPIGLRQKMKLLSNKSQFSYEDLKRRLFKIQHTY